MMKMKTLNITPKPRNIKIPPILFQSKPIF